MRRSNLRWQARKLHAVSSEIFHAVVLDLGVRKFVHVRSERVLALGAEELDVFDHRRRGPEVIIERLGQSADVGLLDVRLLAPLLIVEVVIDAPPREFEVLRMCLTALIITPNLRRRASVTWLDKYVLNVRFIFSRT